MAEEFPNTLDTRCAFECWVSVLATNSVRAARGLAADAENTGDLADTLESRIESEVELEVDDKLDVLAEERAPFDVLRLTERSPSEAILDTIHPEMSTREAALQLAHDALVQDVLAEVEEVLDS